MINLYIDNKNATKILWPDEGQEAVWEWHSRGMVQIRFHVFKVKIYAKVMYFESVGGLKEMLFYFVLKKPFYKMIVWKSSMQTSKENFVLALQDVVVLHPPLHSGNLLLYIL